MTSGNIQMGPDPDQVRDAVDAALRDDPTLREKTSEQVAAELTSRGYLREEPDPVLVAEALGGQDTDGPDDGPGEETEAASPT